MSMDELGIGAGVEDIGKRDFPKFEKGILAGGCNVPFGEPWPSNIPRFSSLRNDDRRKPFIIGLGHKAQQGKDTLAAHLIERLGPRGEGEWEEYFPIDIRRYAFADELKVEVFDYLQAGEFLFRSGLSNNQSQIPIWPLSTIYRNRQEKIDWINENKVLLRPILQHWGTEFRRQQHPDYWVNKTLSFIQQEKPQVAVITDMRFLNETKICDVQINVVRPIQTSLVPQIPVHKSETELDTFSYPYTIVGESVEDLKKKGFDLVEGLLKKRGLLPQ